MMNYHRNMASKSKPVTVTIDEAKLERLDAWVRAGRYENRSRAIDAALELLERRNARPTLEQALARYAALSDDERRALARESEAIDAEADALNLPDPHASSAA
jgi:Arc/MetJ-type ribon-helix-helix transcriptional regulator